MSLWILLLTLVSCVCICKAHPPEPDVLASVKRFMDVCGSQSRLRNLHQVSASDVPMSARDMSADDVTGGVLAS